MKTEKEVMQMLEDAIRDEYVNTRAGYGNDDWNRAHIHTLIRVLDLPTDDVTRMMVRIRKEVMEELSRGLQER